MRKVYGLQGPPSGHAVQPSKSKLNLTQLQRLPGGSDSMDIPVFQKRMSGITGTEEGENQMSVDFVSKLCECAKSYCMLNSRVMMVHQRVVADNPKTKYSWSDC